jgi:hypothetical protein
MRTTIDVDDDVLEAVREIARTNGMTMGQAVSELLREALIRLTGFDTRNGVPLFPKKPDGEIVTLEHVAELYAEVYEEDAELRELTEAALAEWPE